MKFNMRSPLARLSPSSFGRQLVQGFPLATRAQYIENPIGTLPVGYLRTPPAKAVGIDMHRGEGLQDSPQFIRIRNPVVLLLLGVLLRVRFGFCSLMHPIILPIIH